MLSCEYSEFFKNNYFEEPLQWLLLTLKGKCFPNVTLPFLVGEGDSFLFFPSFLVGDFGVSAFSPTVFDSGTVTNSSCIFSGVGAIGAFDSG